MDNCQDSHWLVSREEYYSVNKVSWKHVEEEYTDVVHQARALHTSSWVPNHSVQRYFFRYATTTFDNFCPRHLKLKRVHFVIHITQLHPQIEMIFRNL